MDFVAVAVAVRVVISHTAVHTKTGDSTVKVVVVIRRVDRGRIWEINSTCLSSGCVATNILVDTPSRTIDRYFIPIDVEQLPINVRDFFSIPNGNCELTAHAI